MRLLTIGLLMAMILFAAAAGAETNPRYEAKASVAAHRKEARDKQGRNNIRRQRRSRAQGRHHRGHPTG